MKTDLITDLTTIARVRLLQAWPPSVNWLQLTAMGVFLALLASLLAGRAGAGQSAAPTAAGDLPVTVVQAHPVARVLSAEALVEAVRQATVAAQVAGRVLDVRVDAGQAVRQGELLVRIDAREASENAAAAEAQRTNARASYGRTEKLVAQGFLSPAAMDKARADLRSAEAQAGATRAGESYASVLAPLAGRVAQRLVEAGEMATPGRPLVNVYDPAELRVSAQVAQGDLGRLQGVRKALIELDGGSVAATAVQVFPTVDMNTHTVTVRAGLPKQLPAGVVPGGFARVHFLLGEATRLTVPEQALVRRGEMVAVYVLSEQGSLSLRQVRLGERFGDSGAGGESSGGLVWEVLAGLSAGDKVVLDPAQAVIRAKAASHS